MTNQQQRQHSDDEHVVIARRPLAQHAGGQPTSRTDFKAMLCWMNERKLRLNHRYVIRHTTKNVRAIINETDFKTRMIELALTRLQAIPHRIPGDAHRPDLVCLQRPVDTGDLDRSVERFLAAAADRA